MLAVFAWYNNGGAASRLDRKDKHEAMLAADITAAVIDYNADVILLRESGQTQKGFPEKEWLVMRHRIIGKGIATYYRSR